MAKNDVERLTDEKIAKGGVLAKLYFDVQGTGKDKLQGSLAQLVSEGIMKEKGVVYAFGSIEEPIERDGIFITSGMITVLVENIVPLVGIAMRYAPAGIEILKPEKEIHIKPNEVQSVLMDLSQMSITYSQFILEKMKPEEIERIRKQMEGRALIGKEFLEKHKKGEKEEDEKR